MRYTRQHLFFFSLFDAFSVIRSLGALFQVRPEAIHEVVLERRGEKPFSVNDVLGLFSVRPPNLKKAYFGGMFLCHRFQI